MIRIKEILDKDGYSMLWNETAPINAVWLKASLKLRINDINAQNWKEEMAANSSCHIYKMFKTNLKLEPYLKILDESDRTVMSKFRSGSHRLPIALNRHTNTVTERKCNLCSLDDQGDEFHYVLICLFFLQGKKIIYSAPLLYKTKCY